MKNNKKLFIGLLFTLSTLLLFAEQKSELVSWKDAPSLKEAYNGKIDYIGVAVPHTAWPSEEKIYSSPSYQEMIGRHFSSVTMENDAKPDSLLGTYYTGEPKLFEDFTDSFGNTIKVPKNKLRFITLDECLATSKKLGIKMRGHVLVWHISTPDWFFKKGYKSSENFVDKETMTARQEWYIKSVLEHIKAWEDKNNNGNRIIYCWDVVNEAASDIGTKIRDEGSNWYSIYKSDEFIINAFRFANKYAPKDVALVYNDYNEWLQNKREMILKIIKTIQSHENDDFLPTRIDAVGLQSHINMTKPLRTDYERIIKEFLKTGLDIHITELEIASLTKSDAKNPKKLKKMYNDFYKLYLKYAKTDNKNGVESVTVWGINDNFTWLNFPANGQLQWLNNVFQYPLLFDENNNAKPAFFGALEAAQ